jgi:hypothetical protein
MTTRSQWGIRRPHGEDDEEDRLRAAADRRAGSSIEAHDNEAEHKVIIYGPRGQALVSQKPRPVGFRSR